jgi:hypothetical protein
VPQGNRSSADARSKSQRDAKLEAVNANLSKLKNLNVPGLKTSLSGNNLDKDKLRVLLAQVKKIKESANASGIGKSGGTTVNAHGGKPKGGSSTSSSAMAGSTHDSNTTSERKAKQKEGNYSSSSSSTSSSMVGSSSAALGKMRELMGKLEEMQGASGTKGLNSGGRK